jgi:hypothetical protein
MIEADIKSLIHNYIKDNLKVKQRGEVIETTTGTCFETYIDLVLTDEIISSYLTDRCLSSGFDFRDYEK